jgi:UDP-glucuronate decarboxylase
MKYTTLRAPASPVHYQHDPVQMTKISVHGAINMLDYGGLCSILRCWIAAGSWIAAQPQLSIQKCP